jgi:hypothetical protein
MIVPHIVLHGRQAVAILALREVELSIELLGKELVSEVEIALSVIAFVFWVRIH